MPTRLQLQFLLFKWLNRRPEHYDDGETRTAKQNVCFESSDYQAEQVNIRWSTREDTLIDWLDIDKKISKLHPIDKRALYEYLKDKKDVNLAYWDDLPEDLESALMQHLGILLYDI